MYTHAVTPHYYCILLIFILCDSIENLMVYLIQLNSYIDSLRQGSYHHVMCAKFHLLEDPNITYDGPLLNQELPNNNIDISKYVAVQQRVMGC